MENHRFTRSTLDKDAAHALQVSLHLQLARLVQDLARNVEGGGRAVQRLKDPGGPLQERMHPRHR